MAVADEAIEKLKAMIVSGELRPTLANPCGDVIVVRGEVAYSWTARDAASRASAMRPFLGGAPLAAAPLGGVEDA